MWFSRSNEKSTTGVWTKPEINNTTAKFIHGLKIVIFDKFHVVWRQKSLNNNRFSLLSRPSERFYRPEMSQIKAETSLHTNVKLILPENVGWQGYQWIP